MADRVLVYDCFSGISGDMHIGAMLDLGVPLELLNDELARLGLGDEFSLEVRRADKHGITGTQATVRLKHHDHHHHRHLSDIRQIIESAGYPAVVQQRALDIFMRIAVAEAKIHDIPVESVHFHEVGATDAIVDIVAAAVCLEHLGIDRASCMTLELGGGMVRCAHGLMPVPAPATAEILTGVSCRYNGVDQEATTPTGAAILRHAVDEFGTPDGFRAERIGYGVGQKDFTLPNVMRVLIGTVDSVATEDWYVSENNLQIDCNIDDMSPEAFQPLFDRLFAAGAKDVFLTPIVMKKSRPGTMLSTLCAEGDSNALLRVLFENSSSIGVRVHPVAKRMLHRTQRSCSTSLGEVSVKFVQLPDGRSRFKVEHEDVLRIAESTGQDYLQIRRTLDDEVARLHKGADS